MKKTIFALALLGTLYGEDFQEIFKIGQKGAKTLLTTLKSEMKKQIKENGIEGAAQFCAFNAMVLTHKVNQELGENVSVKRISTKYRNPMNKPNESEAKILFMLENTNSPVLTKVERKGEEDKEIYKFYQPLRIKPVCLKCHGTAEDMPEGIRNTIHKIYPEDKATGYKLGDLRGAIVVTIERDKEKEEK
ncbi:MAG TPA: DUF3365 domain-containing protein [Campylobacterales bacterium]|nr:DUF3365 domain-containing protein [Campylobacterales bacterium]